MGMSNGQPPASVEEALHSGVLPRVLQRFVVNDLTRHLQPRSGQVIMLFESPQWKEVLAGHPLAGSSGKEALRAFCTTNETPPYTLGEVLSLSQFSFLRRLGVMNVSRLPLQDSPYPYSVRRQLPSRLLPSFKVVREGPKAWPERRLCRNRYFARLVQNDLQSRVERIRRRLGANNVKFVTCGDVAKFHLCRVSGVQASQELTHPAERGNWANLDEVTQMVSWYRQIG